MTGLNGVLAVRLVVSVIKKDQRAMSVQISKTMSKLEPAVSHFQMFHTMNGLHGVNALQLVPVVLWFVPLNIFVVKCSVVIPPLVAQKATGKNGDHGLAAVSHVEQVQ